MRASQAPRPDNKDSWATLTELEHQFFTRLIEATESDEIAWKVEASSNSYELTRYTTKWNNADIMMRNDVRVDRSVILRRIFPPLVSVIDDQSKRLELQRRQKAEEVRIQQAEVAMRELLKISSPKGPPAAIDDLEPIIKDLDGMIEHGS